MTHDSVAVPPPDIQLDPEDPGVGAHRPEAVVRTGASRPTRPPRLVRRLLGAFEQFVRTEAIGGLLLMATAIVALAWANSPWRAGYHHLWELPLAVGPSGRALTLSLHGWINDGLMALFFLLVGLEIKREVRDGELASIRHAALPLVGALGGMVLPALLFAGFTAGTEAARGWGIPMATDIAFALGIVTLLGDRVPTPLKVFLAALAIADDIGAVLVIALFYTASIQPVALLAAGGVLLLLVGLNRRGVVHPVPYLLIGLVLWGAVLASGVHATIAGVLLALAMPGATGTRLEHALHRPVAFLIMPLFALANAGVPLGGDLAAVATSPVVVAIVIGLVAGKLLGITGAAWLAVRLRIAALPSGATWRQLIGVAALGGIGFTMSLFVAGLAYTDAAMLDAAKIGILGGSFVAGLLGWLILRGGARAPDVAAEGEA